MEECIGESWNKGWSAAFEVHDIFKPSKMDGKEIPLTNVFKNLDSVIAVEDRTADYKNRVRVKVRISVILTIKAGNA